MTEQPPSASKEALDLAERIRDWQTAEWVGAAEIDALIAQRVSAETERCLAAAATPVGEAWSGDVSPVVEEIRERIRRAPAERPAPEPVHLTLREQSVMTRALLRSTRPAPEATQGTDRPVSGSREPGWFWVRWKSGPPTDFDGGWYIARRHSVIDAPPQNDYWDKGPWLGQGAPFDEIGPRIMPPSALASTGEQPDKEEERDFGKGSV